MNLSYYQPTTTTILACSDSDVPADRFDKYSLKEDQKGIRFRIVDTVELDNLVQWAPELSIYFTATPRCGGMWNRTDTWGGYQPLEGPNSTEIQVDF
jgi:hypothetical protein